MNCELMCRCATGIRESAQSLYPFHVRYPYKSSLQGVIYAIAFWLLLFFCDAGATTFPLPAGDDSLIGEMRTATIHPGENLGDFLAKNQIGYFELVEANSDESFEQPQGGTTYVIPLQHILPDALRQGIVINLSEPRLYYYPPSGNYVLTYPIGIGRDGLNTPVMQTKIIEKRLHPVWVPTEATRKRDAVKGIIYPAFIPAGPQNPLGAYALRLGLPDYSIHGTNDPYGVGLRISYGCIRMTEEDIRELFSLVSVGTEVNIVDQPVKVGLSDGILYAEVHRLLSTKITDQQAAQQATELLTHLLQKEEAKYPLEIDWDKATAVAQLHQGIPIAIGKVVQHTVPNPVSILKAHAMK